jgi:hypothetical protein
MRAECRRGGIEGIGLRELSTMEEEWFKAGIGIVGGFVDESSEGLMGKVGKVLLFEDGI